MSTNPSSSRERDSGTGASAPVFFQQRGEAVLLIDYENLIGLTQALRMPDFWRLKEDFAKEMNVDFRVSFVFLPLVHSVSQDAQYYFEQNIFPILCPKIPGQAGVKDKDKVDFIMITLTERLFLTDPRVTDVIIVSNDGDFLPLVTSLRDHGKRVFVYGYGKMSYQLKQAVGDQSRVREIPSRAVPSSSPNTA